MSITLNDLEKIVNSNLTTAVKKSGINFDQLFIDVDVENVISTIWHLIVYPMLLHCPILNLPPVQ